MPFADLTLMLRVQTPHLTRRPCDPAPMDSDMLHVKT